MPTYTYRCTRCGAEVEAIQSMSDPPLKRCKTCRGALKRTFHPVGIVLKGSGFYKTDYASSRGGSSKDRDTSSSKDSGSSKGSGGSKEGSKEAKPPKSSGSKDSGSKDSGSKSSS